MDDSNQLMSEVLPSLSEQIQKESAKVTSAPSSQSSTLRIAQTRGLMSTMVKGRSSSTLTPTSQMQIHRRAGDLPRVHIDTRASGKSKESTGQDVVELLAEVEGLKRTREEKNDLNGLKKIIEMLNDVLADSKSDQARDLLPILEAATNLRNLGEDSARKAEKLHIEWVDQKAGEIASKDEDGWGEIEGRTLSQIVELV